MDNPDNNPNPFKPISNTGIFSPNKGSPMKNPNISKYNNPFLLSQSPYPSKKALFNTPSKFYEGRSLFPSYADTPLKFNMNINIPISPLYNNQKMDTPFQNEQNMQKNYSNFLKTFASPNYTDKR